MDKGRKLWKSWFIEFTYESRFSYVQFDSTTNQIQHYLVTTRMTFENEIYFICKGSSSYLSFLVVILEKY